MRIKIVLAVITAAALLSGCGTALQPAAAALPQESLVFYSWVGYMPQSILDAFTAEFGIPVEYRTYVDQDEALVQLRAGEQFDVVVLGDTYIPAAIDAGLLAELDYESIPNFRYLGANFRDLTYDPENRYSIMIQWGTTGLLVRTDRTAQPVTAWADLWNVAYTGKIGVWPYREELIGIALKSLGYPLDSEDPDQLEAAAQKLLQLRKSVYLLDPNLPTGAPYLLDDHTVMIYGWSYDAMQAQQFDTIAYVLPKEGTMLWTDSVTIPANSPHKEAAEQFINFLLRPQISAQMVNELWIPSPNEGARPYIEPEILNNPLVYPPPESLSGAELYTVVSEKTRTQYEQIWARFMAAEGPASPAPDQTLRP